MRLSDATAVSFSTKTHVFSDHFSKRVTKPLKSIYDEWLNVICCNSRLFRTFVKNGV